LAGLAFLGALQASAADTEKMTLPGLAAPAQILVDPWGVPHLYAASADDLFFVQGFNAARDRLFQIDLWRRRGLGRLASVFGPDFVEQDRAARLFLYRGDMAREWRSYGADAQRVATRFVAASMPYIDLVARDPRKAALEFRHFGYAPEKVAGPRTSCASAATAWCATSSRSLARHRRLPQRPEVRHGSHRLSPRWETKIPEGLDPAFPEALRAYTLATQSVLDALRARFAAARSGRGELAARRARRAPKAAMRGWWRRASRRRAGPSSPAIRTALRDAFAALHRAPERAGLSVIGGGEPALARRVDRPQRHASPSA
jgi:penicillin amidase